MLYGSTLPRQNVVRHNLLEFRVRVRSAVWAICVLDTRPALGYAPQIYYGPRDRN